MIRTARWKFIQRLAPHDTLYGDALYDLSNDPRESTNLIAAGAHHVETRNLRQRLETHFGEFENPEKSGRNVMCLPAQNPGEPWRLTAPENIEPAGTDWSVLDRFNTQT